MKKLLKQIISTFIAIVFIIGLTTTSVNAQSSSNTDSAILDTESTFEPEIYGYSDENFCESLPDGVYSNPEDPTTFYHCSNGLSYLKDCPANLEFYQPLERCELPKQIKEYNNSVGVQ